MDQAPPLPKRITRFAPWTWKRRNQLVMLALLSVGYPLSVAPAWALAQHNWLPDQFVLIVYAPVFWCATLHPVLTRVLSEYLWWLAPGCL